uniref:DED domain-containing protein n=1 Tax=Lotharella oceanica TaxID=641309 RepID=A0A7S2TW73_9EUKA|mmetsp:Transcript_32698/g.60806  ORF Transcript_32698/g.60806 Transcript_32698/m.60806 type:complete len:135 (+) Transcript_32698:50-454(+)
MEDSKEDFGSVSRPPSLDFVDRIRLLVLDDDFIAKRCQKLISRDYQQLLEERNMLAREKREMLKQLERMAKENADLVKKIAKGESRFLDMNVKNQELMEKCRKIAEENTALHLENARMRARANKIQRKSRKGNL